MESFPEDFRLPNAELDEKFRELKKQYCVRLLRQQLYLHMLERKENDFFDINRFNKAHVNNEKLCEEIFSVVVAELEALGWKYTISFGGTGLFIYSSENKPVSAW
jgi:hypothetical protein